MGQQLSESPKKTPKATTQQPIHGHELQCVQHCLVESGIPLHFCNFYSDKLADQGYDTPFLLAFGSVQAFLDAGLKPGHAAALAAYMQRVKFDK